MFKKLAAAALCAALLTVSAYAAADWPDWASQAEDWAVEKEFSPVFLDSPHAEVSRGQAAQVISEGRVQVNHVPLRSAHDAVYAGDIFTVRGSGRYRLQEIGGKSRSDRTFILFYQY